MQYYLAPGWPARLAAAAVIGLWGCVGARADTPVEPMKLGNFILIAHRGVVTDTIPENSLAALEESIRRGYSHVEVDLRSTRDGHAVCIHDDNLRHAAGISKRVSELTLAELRALVPVEIVPDFATFCALSEGRIGLMPDIKPWPPDVKEAFARSIEAPMVRHGLMEDAYFIGRRSLTEIFSERGRNSWRASLEEARASDRIHDRPGDRYFIFGHGADFDAESVRGFQALGLKVIVSINMLHYLRIGDFLEYGNRDVARMLEYGVDGLQIDSVYEPAFREYFDIACHGRRVRPENDRQ